MKKRYIFYVIIYLILLFLLYYQITEPIKTISEEGFIEIYFCDEINCAYFLNTFLNSSKDVVCALYDLEEETVLETINKNKIEIKLFEENYEDFMPENILPVGSKGLMHHKFCVTGDYVFTGSWNPTMRGTYKNDNYIIFLKSKSLSQNYLKAYESLDEEQEAKPIHLNLSNTYVENYFCPEHNCEEEILDELNKANESVLILAFSFTSKPIAEELIQLNNSGVDIEVLFEKTRIASYSQYYTLNKSNVSVYKDKNPYTMHEKVIVIDKKTSIIGSYNPTKAATERNDENILIVHDAGISRLFVEEFYDLT